MPTRQLLSVALLVCVWWQGCKPARGADAPGPRFTAPANEPELAARVEELRRHYEPYLRSLPPRLPARQRVALPAQWTFTFEARETPKAEGLPPAPAWYTADFDDSRWATTTVPEWRYRTRESDTARDPQRVDAWKAGGTTADTICWYRTTFSAERPPAGQRLWLCFDGVDWEAQVYLNGQLLGTHRVYYEPFRFEVTDKLQPANSLAVRVIAGRSYGEPMTYWALFPDIRAAQQRYVPDRAGSIPGNLPIGYHAGCGFGIHRAVYLERSGPVLLRSILARNDLSDASARVKVELDSAGAGTAELQVELLPENCAGRSYRATQAVDLPDGRCERGLIVPMPEARAWSPETPHLYRCRVSLKGGDAQDVLFGCRSFSLVHRGQPEAKLAPQPLAAGDLPGQLPNGMLLLNGRPLYLRGTNIQGLNAYSYWGQTERLLHTLLLLKAGNFNIVRCCQHVEFPEVREWMDRVGMLSEQDQGGGYRGSIDMGVRRQQHIHTGAVLARTCYNNPGVVLLTFGNEHHFDTAPILRAALAVDPQRIFKPISGRFSHSREPLILPDEMWPNVIDDGHPYSGWYGKTAPQTWSFGETWTPRRLVTLGEFGAEALDAYATMRDHYPPQFQPPPPDTDTLWAASQVEKHDRRQIVGLGRNPVNLGQYIEASQNYQEAVLADKVIGMRLSPRAIAGYFHFHFIDVVPVFWPKSIVSHDHRPKKAYYQLAQLNQPVVPLAQLTGAKPDAMTLWVANDLDEPLNRCTLDWAVAVGGKSVLHGAAALDVPPLDAVRGPQIDLRPVTARAAAFDLTLVLSGAAGRVISRYQRQVRCVPDELLKPEAR
jgi:beta-mannosidase